MGPRKRKLPVGLWGLANPDLEGIIDHDHGDLIPSKKKRAEGGALPPTGGNGLGCVVMCYVS